MDSHGRLDRTDALLLGGVLACLGLYTARVFNFSQHPFEDAAILLRYAEHVAHGHGVVWNVGEAPVDGATDFLFMLLLAGLVRAGLAVERAAHVVGFASHVLTIVVVYGATRTVQRGSRWAALISAAYLAFGPGLALIQTQFGTPAFALFAALTWFYALRLHERPDARASAIAFAVSGLVLGLLRPEGALLAVFMWFSVILLHGVRPTRNVTIVFLSVFLVVGGAYFLWRWHYFGHPLPTPFYKKGGGRLHVAGLRQSMWNVVRLCGPFLPAYAFGIRTTDSAKRTLAALVPVVAFTAIWVLLSNEMNFFGRFQYALLPVVLMSWPRLVRVPSFAALSPPMRMSAIAGTILLACAATWYANAPFRRIPFVGDGRYDVALRLQAHKDKGYTLVTTEAGLLPLYSRWRTIDAWGLNDPQIAHAGRITAEYLAEQEPHVIMFHAFYSPAGPSPRGADSLRPPAAGWDHMVRVLHEYAEAHGYILAAAFGHTPQHTHYYFVRPDFADTDAIVAAIRSGEYFAFSPDRPCMNFAGAPPPSTVPAIE